jgi:hypothetical protein
VSIESRIIVLFRQIGEDMADLDLREAAEDAREVASGLSVTLDALAGTECVDGPVVDALRMAATQLMRVSCELAVALGTKDDV